MGDTARAHVRVVTINTWKGDGPYAARIATLIEQLRALDADVIALQEAVIATDRSVSTPDALAAALDMRAVSAATRLKPRMIEGREIVSWSALTILTRWPVVASASYALPASPEDPDRSVLFATLDTRAGTMHVANAHLTHLRAASDVRREELEAVMASTFFERPAAIRLLCGDMNAGPDSPEVEWLLDRHGDAATSHWHLLDTCRESPEPNVTLSDRNAFVRAGTGSRRIDYIFSLAHDADTHPAISGAQVVLDRPGDSGVYPSDHFGVAVTVGG